MIKEAKRFALSVALAALTMSIVNTASAQGSCPWDVVGTTQFAPTLAFLPDGQVTADFSNPSWWEDDTVACYYSYTNPAYLVYFPGCDFDGSGIVEVTELLDVYYYAISTGGLSTPCPTSCPAGIPEYYDPTTSELNWTASGVCGEFIDGSGEAACSEADYMTFVDDLTYITSNYPFTNAVFDAATGGMQTFNPDPYQVICGGMDPVPASEFIFDEINTCYHASTRCLFDCNMVFISFDWGVNPTKALADYTNMVEAAVPGGWCEKNGLVGGAPTGFHATDAGSGWRLIDVHATDQCSHGGCRCDATLSIFSNPDQPGVYIENSVVNNSSCIDGTCCNDPRFNF